MLGSPWTASLAIAAGNTVEALLALYLVRRFVPAGRIFDHTESTVHFVLLAGFVSTLVGATAGTLALLVSGGLAAGTQTLSAWFLWWMGGATGVILVAPLLIMFTGFKWSLWRPDNFKYFLGVFILTAVMEKLAFGGWLQFLPQHFPMAFLTLPPLLVGAFWVGRRWEMITVLFLAVLATQDTLMGLGPFAGYPLNESLLLLQMFLGTAAITTLLTSTLIAERRAATDSLAEREKYFRALIEKSSDGLVLVDSEGRILYASPSLKRMTGYTRAEVPPGTLGASLVHSADAAILGQNLRAVAEAPEKTLSFEVRLRHQAGNWLWVAVTATNLLQYEPVRGIVLNLRDISREKAARRTESYLAAIVESADDAVIGRDLEGTITSWNRSAERLYGYPAAEAIGQPITLIIPLDRRYGEFTDISDRIRRGENAHYETVRLRKDGTLIPVSFVVSPMRGEAGKVIGASIIARDRAKEKELERRKHEFVSSLSYRLRAPIGEIGMYVGSLLKRKRQFSALEQQYLLKIEEANIRVAELLNNLLRVTRLSLDTMPVVPRPTELKREIDYVAREFAEKLGARTIALERPYRRANAVTVTLDPALLTAALGSLFSHALASVPAAGAVSVDFAKSDRDIQIHIRERGSAGLPGATEKRKGLPDRRTEADWQPPWNRRSGADRRAPKKGVERQAPEEGEDPSLDLYVARALIERLGGAFRSEYTDNGETKFSIVFPLK
jgi:PAS domain S-box-containing protein